MADKVGVAVRLRPLNERELALNTACVVDMINQQTLLYHPSNAELPSRQPYKTFAFDHCFWSVDERNKKRFASQQDVYTAVGTGVLDNAMAGYNACIFAYGQTGSGKSYTMMGMPGNFGVIPRLCQNVFERIAQLEEGSSCKVEISYFEIYNEKVRDLFEPPKQGAAGATRSLRVREHKLLGPYVDGLKHLAVTTYEQIEELIREGNKSRTVAATQMNSESSRSHAVFTLSLTQTLTHAQIKGEGVGDESVTVTGEKVSKISLVDLAGSERAHKSGAVGDRLKEGSTINKSLTTLGLVISALADQAAAAGANPAGNATPTARSRRAQKFVPYRDSVLTWLLKDNLGGNSRTVMVATVSPAADNFDETLSTLRYADRAKRIVNHAVINEDPNAKIIRQLKEEVEMLRKELNEARLNMSLSMTFSSPSVQAITAVPSANDSPLASNVMSASTIGFAGSAEAGQVAAGERPLQTSSPYDMAESNDQDSGDISEESKDALRQRLIESERLVRDMSRTWQERLDETERNQKERQAALAKLGISLEHDDEQSAQLQYCLVNLNSDPSLNEMLVYYMRKPKVLVGRSETAGADVQLDGLGIHPEHCWLEVDEQHSQLTMRPATPNARCSVNGRSVSANESVPLKHGDRVLWGYNHLYGPVAHLGY